MTIIDTLNCVRHWAFRASHGSHSGRSKLLAEICREGITAGALAISLHWALPGDERPNLPVVRFTREFSIGDFSRCGIRSVCKTDSWVSHQGHEMHINCCASAAMNGCLSIAASTRADLLTTPETHRSSRAIIRSDTRFGTRRRYILRITRNSLRFKHLRDIFFQMFRSFGVTAC